MFSLEDLFCHIHDFCQTFEPKWQAQLLSHGRFVEWMPSTRIPLCAYLKSGFGQCTGISCVESSKVAVCHNRRISQHRGFKDWAERGTAGTFARSTCYVFLTQTRFLPLFFAA
jgi:hypothetical protein